MGGPFLDFVGGGDTTVMKGDIQLMGGPPPTREYPVLNFHSSH